MLLKWSNIAEGGKAKGKGAEKGRYINTQKIGGDRKRI